MRDGFLVDVKIDDTSYPEHDERRKDGLTIGCEVRFMEGRWQVIRVFHAVDVSGADRKGDVLERDLDVAKARCEARAVTLSEARLVEKCEELDRRIDELERHCYWGGIGLPVTIDAECKALLFPTGYSCARTGEEIVDWRLPPEPGFDGGGWIRSRETESNPDDPMYGHPKVLGWYCVKCKVVSAEQMLANLVIQGKIKKNESEVR